MTKNIFEKIKKINDFNQEFWSARELSTLLGYSEYNKFLPAIERAKTACETSKQEVLLHFAHVGEMVAIGLGVKRNIDDYNLSRYACYLIAMNGDSRKEEVAMAQSYFAIQTRKQELGNEASQDLIEDRNRVYLIPNPIYNSI